MVTIKDFLTSVVVIHDESKGATPVDKKLKMFVDVWNNNRDNIVFFHDYIDRISSGIKNRSILLCWSINLHYDYVTFVRHFTYI